ncbi:MAG: SET domain-containing protein-lysine N-methyltransferase [Promethearchaeota archaeon]|nr:MAG: SET domain-containing protein-lysine N-methyltransferase [Candidatus Lokiarchaeota archaeon]
MSELIEVKRISLKKGRGVIAKKGINKGTLIEKANVLLIPNKDYEKIQDTILHAYTFEWQDPKYDGEYACAIALSICQFINHSYHPNVKYIYDYENDTIEYYAIKKIQPGEELSVNYNGKIRDNAPLWFEIE